MKRAGIDSSSLSTLSDLEELSDLDPEDTRWILVDHNKLTGPLGQRFGMRAVGCIDHHVDEGAVPEDTGDEPRVLEKPKSCISLVVCYNCKTLLDLSENLRSQSSLYGKSFVQELVNVALAPILVDTRNSKEKTEPYAKDREAVALLEDFRGEPLNESERDAYFDLLIERKVAIEEMSLKDNFRKDYKSWTENDIVLGMSTIPQEPGYIFEKMGVTTDTLVQEWRAFADERKLDIACIMASTPPGQSQSSSKRWILLWARNEKAAMAANRFYDANYDTLGLVPLPDYALDLRGISGEYRRFWRMDQPQHTRKQVGPMIRSAMKEIAKI